MGWIADLLKEIPSAARYKSELEEIEKENISLKAKNSILRLENETLRKQLVAQKGRINDVNQDAEKILIFIADHEYVTSSQIAHALSMNKRMTDMHLENLVTSKHICVSEAIDQEPKYFIEQSGRRYLHAKQLL